MKNIVSELFKSCDYYISSAAIGDIHFSLATDEKMKKEDIKNALPIEKSPDILKHVLSKKKDHQKVVGFAAESELTDSVISEKMTRKPVDLLVATKVHNGLTGDQQTAGFQGDGATYRLIKQGSFGQEVNLSKKELAKYILGHA
jgi:phosphopantothenoylcysteine decarboxylase/phosphopantothenate--cysteine ligase